MYDLFDFIYSFCIEDGGKELLHLIELCHHYIIGDDGGGI